MYNAYNINCFSRLTCKTLIYWTCFKHTFFKFYIKTMFFNIHDPIILFCIIFTSESYYKYPIYIIIVCTWHLCEIKCHKFGTIIFFCAMFLKLLFLVLFFFFNQGAFLNKPPRPPSLFLLARSHNKLSFMISSLKIKFEHLWYHV